MDEGGGLLFAFLLLATVGLVLMSGDQSSDTMDCPTGSNSDSICYALQNKTTTECIYSDDKDDIDDSSDDDDDDDDDDEDHKDECTLTKNVTEYVCVCCKGWGKDENGVCSVKKNQTAPKFCENGGSLIDGVCSCLDGFTGEHCEDAICDPACQNHGVCIGRNGVPTCSCSSNFTGQYCETPICGNQCLNGASCYSYYPGIYCRCPPDYTGERCETKLKSGFCPPIQGLGICVHMCSNDSSCEGNKKCCSNGCGHVCTDPVDEPLCIYNNTYYNKTTQLYKDPCTFCTCIGIGLANNDDGFVCAVIDCALINCPNGKTIKHPDKCCAECEENTTKVAPPVFTSCPKYENVEVDDYRNYACLRYMLGEKVVAKDAYGKRLTVKFSSKSFTHCGCDDNGRNMHKVVATAMDSYGQTANCSFMVNVIDPHPPQFQSCPNNISQFNTELVQWKEPKAVDNVHIKDISIYKHMSSGNGEYFDVGVHTIIYVATDYAGNRAECIFLVVIWKRGSNDVSMPNRLKHSGEAEKRTTMVAALAAACAILVVAGVVLTLFCCHRGRARNLIRGPIPANKNGFDNKVYGQYGGALPPSYEKSVEYDAPPLYEELDTTALENPVYADPEEIKVSVEKLRLEFKE